MEAGRIINDRGDERCRWDQRSQHGDQWVTPDPAVDAPILRATGDQQAHREAGERGCTEVVRPTCCSRGDALRLAC